MRAEYPCDLQSHSFFLISLSDTLGDAHCSNTELGHVALCSFCQASLDTEVNRYKKDCSSETHGSLEYTFTVQWAI